MPFECLVDRVRHVHLHCPPSQSPLTPCVFREVQRYRTLLFNNFTMFAISFHVWYTINHVNRWILKCKSSTLDFPHHICEAGVGPRNAYAVFLVRADAALPCPLFVIGCQTTQPVVKPRPPSAWRYLGMSLVSEAALASSQNLS